MCETLKKSMRGKSTGDLNESEMKAMKDLEKYVG